MRDPLTFFLSWMMGFIMRRMRLMAVLCVIFLVFIFATEGLSWTSAIFTVIMAFFFLTFFAVATTFGRMFAAMNERKPP